MVFLCDIVDDNELFVESDHGKKVYIFILI